MSLRERVLLVLGILGAIGLVIYPLAYRMTSAESTAGAEVVASVAPVAPSATASALPSPTPTPVAPTAIPTDDPWFANAMGHRGEDGAEYQYDCPSNGAPAQIWGTDVYTDDTSVCTAGVHAGVITREDGGTVSIIIRPGLVAYAGSIRNGVASEPYEAWGGSYEVVTP